MFLLKMYEKNSATKIYNGIFNKFEFFVFLLTIYIKLSLLTTYILLSVLTMYISLYLLTIYIKLSLLNIYI